MTLYLGNNLISGASAQIDGSIAIGQIIPSIIPLSDAGLHLLDGSLIQGSGIYSDFVTYIAGLSSSYPSCFTDETTWQNTVNNKGVCGKFVYNSTNNTVRLPKITGFIEGTVNSNELGDLINAGLPNITGAIGSFDVWGYGDAAIRRADGAFNFCDGQNNLQRTVTIQSNVAGNDYRNVDFNASRSSSIYGNSSTVQPQSIKVFYYIVIATTTKTDIEVDIDEIATDLNSKANDADVVHKTGNEIIVGEKTFVNKIGTSSLELSTSTPFIDFHFNESPSDFTSRIIEFAEGHLEVEKAELCLRDYGLHAGQLRIINSVGDYGMIFRYDGSGNLYVFPTAQNDAYGTWNGTDKGIVIDSSGGYVYVKGQYGKGLAIADLGKLKAENGYVKLSNGFIIQWGVVSTNNYQTATITFPIPFTDTYSQSLCQYYGGYTGEYNANALVYERTLTYMRIEGQTSGIYWIAIGF